MEIKEYKKEKTVHKGREVEGTSVRIIPEIEGGIGKVMVVVGV